jgi:hypothetical protein
MDTRESTTDYINMYWQASNKNSRVFGGGEVNTDHLFAVQQMLFLQTRF